MLKTLYYDENVIQKLYKTTEMSFVVVCGKMGQEEDVAQESKVKRAGSTGYTQTKRSDER